MGEDGKLTGGKEFADCTAGRFDGMRFDTDGRLWAATDDGVHCLDTDGTLIGKVKIPEICSNVVFGGPKRNYSTSRRPIRSMACCCTSMG